QGIKIAPKALVFAALLVAGLHFFPENVGHIRNLFSTYAANLPEAMSWLQQHLTLTTAATATGSLATFMLIGMENQIPGKVDFLVPPKFGLNPLVLPKNDARQDLTTIPGNPELAMEPFKTIVAKANDTVGTFSPAKYAQLTLDMFESAPDKTKPSKF